VFEIICDAPQRLRLETRLFHAMDPQHDSIRIYQLNRGTFTTAKHLGASIDPPHHTPLII
jgi:CRISPR-associated protein Cas2